MKVIKIGALWCPSCLIMNSVYKKLLPQYGFLDITELDIDIHQNEAERWHPGTILPVVIFVEDNVERHRIVGEKSKKEIIKYLEEWTK
ncbi:MAG: thioredoxin family protein [Bacillus subtilis]|nr:thioredoxin family protein [Bacillus subtilis]